MNDLGLSEIHKVLDH